jgi:hypothetical protein
MAPCSVHEYNKLSPGLIAPYLGPIVPGQFVIKTQIAPPTQAAALRV